MSSVASQLIEEVTAHAQSDSIEDAREICADGTYFPNNLRNAASRGSWPLLLAVHISAEFLNAAEVGLHDCERCLFFNFLKPTSHVMHQQFNIQQLYVLPTLYLCVLYLSENKQRLVPLTA